MRRCRVLPQLAASPLVAARGTAARPRPAADRPTRPVRIVAVFPPGGSSGMAARVPAEHRSQRLGAALPGGQPPGPTARHRPDEHGIASRPASSSEFRGFAAGEMRKVGGTIRATGTTAR
jgi:hypothetical protein